MKLTHRIRDWWRGYSEADVLSLQTKWRNALESLRPGQIIRLTEREARALENGEPAHEMLSGGGT